MHRHFHPSDDNQRSTRERGLAVQAESPQRRVAAWFLLQRLPLGQNRSPWQSRIALSVKIYALLYLLSAMLQTTGHSQVND
jgi:hypothetical protein